MPTPDEELDLLLRAGEDSLPTAEVPPVPDFTKPAPTAAQPSAADAELDAVLADLDKEGAPAAEGGDRIGHGEEMPVQLIEAQPDAAGEAYTRGLKSEVKPDAWYSNLLGSRRQDGDPLSATTNPGTAEEYSKYAQNLASVPGVAKNFAAATAANASGAPVGLGGTAALGALQGATSRAADDPNATAGDVAGSGAVGGMVAGGLSALGTGLSGLAGDARKAANEYLTHIFMTPAQRAGYAAAKGPDALSKLGAQAESAGMFKPRGVLDHLLPRNARRVAENAEKVRATAGPAIGQFEDEYVKGSTAEVPVGDIAEGLRDKASQVGEMVDTAAPADASVMSKMADRLEQVTPVANDEALPISTVRENMPLPEAVANKRDIANRIDWSKKRSDQTTYGQEAARKYTWGELSDRITNALQDEVTRGKIPASAMAQYKKNMADFSTAATVYDPALKMAERNGQTGLGLTDLLTASAVGGGPAGGLAALSSRATRGMAPAAAARFNAMLAGMAEFGGPAAAGAARVAPQLTAIEQAQQDAPEGTPKYEIVDAANRQLKSQIHGLEPLLPRNQ